MKFFLLYLAPVLLVACGGSYHDDPPCGVCDTLTLKASWQARLPAYLPDSDFYARSKDENRLRWFDETEYPDSTFQTRLWDDYHSHNYHTSHEDFQDYYSDKQDVQLAFQIGPSGPLWSFYTFVLKKTSCCHVITRTTFAHGRFRYKGYAILNSQQTDSLLVLINTLDHDTREDEGWPSMYISVANNVRGEVFDTWVAYDMNYTPPDSSILRMIHFVDNRIRWRETYPLDPPEQTVTNTQKLVEEFDIEATCLNDSVLTGTLRMERRGDRQVYYAFHLEGADHVVVAGKSGMVTVASDSAAFDMTRLQAEKEIRRANIGKYKRITTLYFH